MEQRRFINRVYLRILIYDESVVLRFRTAGKPFDPVKYAETDPELAGDSMGIRMVQKLSRSVLYDRVFGVNNLTIIF